MTMNLFRHGELPQYHQPTNAGETVPESSGTNDNKPRSGKASDVGND
jgi:hypothetical protein